MKNEWEREASAILKSLLAREGLRYKGLALRLEEMGIQESPDQLRNKVNRGTFSFTFFLKCLHALRYKDAQFNLKPILPAKPRSAPDKR